MVSPLLLLLYITQLSDVTTAIAQEICCCPDLNINLNCSDTDSSKLETNGFRCVALANSNVTLQCNVADVNHRAIASVRYMYYKAYELAYKPVMFEDSSLLLDCYERNSTCELTNVMWSDATFSTQKFETYHNFIYQCLVEFTLIDDTVLNLTSNTMWLDVLYNIDIPTDEVNQTDKNPLNTNNPYERLLCDLPSTNPATQAKWYYKNESADESAWSEIDIPGHPRMALVDNDIADESSGSFEVGTLVIMIFDPDSDEGLYRCNATYTNTLGASTEYKVAQYKITGDGQTYSGTPEVKMISAITSDEFTTLNESVNFTCYARDTDATDEGLYQWVFENSSTVNYEFVNTSSMEFDGIQILNNNRTLSLPSYYKFYDTKFKCNVTRDSLTKMSNEFMQPVIVPKTMSPPSDYKTCANTGDNFEFYTNQRYMVSDISYNLDVDDYVQKLPGASHVWFINDNKVTAFSNPAPGKQNETYLNVTDDIYQSAYDGNPEQKCIYFSFLQTHSSEYQMIEVLKLTKLNTSCSDLNEEFCDAITLSCDTTASAGVSTVTVDVGSTDSQCLSVEVLKGDQSLVTKAFDTIASSCASRTLTLTFDKNDTGEEADLSGEYTILVTPEGKTGCSQTIDTDQRCNFVDDDGVLEETFDCPSKYYNDDYNTPWTVNASESCDIDVANLSAFNIVPSDEKCYDIEIDKKTRAICALNDSLTTNLSLTHDTIYELSYTWVESENTYNCTNFIQLQCIKSGSVTISYSVILLLTIFFVIYR